MQGKPNRLKWPWKIRKNWLVTKKTHYFNNFTNPSSIKLPSRTHPSYVTKFVLYFNTSKICYITIKFRLHSHLAQWHASPSIHETYFGRSWLPKWMSQVTHICNNSKVHHTTWRCNVPIKILQNMYKQVL